MGSQVDYATGSVTLGIAVAFAGMIAHADAHARRARAPGPRCGGSCAAPRATSSSEGVLVRIFASTAVVAGVAFAFWFVIIQGPAP